MKEDIKFNKGGQWSIEEPKAELKKSALDNLIDILKKAAKNLSDSTQIRPATTPTNNRSISFNPLERPKGDKSPSMDELITSGKVKDLSPKATSLDGLAEEYKKMPGGWGKPELEAAKKAKAGELHKFINDNIDKDHPDAKKAFGYLDDMGSDINYDAAKATKGKLSGVKDLADYHKQFGDAKTHDLFKKMSHHGPYTFDQKEFQGLNHLQDELTEEYAKGANDLHDPNHKHGDYENDNNIVRYNFKKLKASVPDTDLKWEDKHDAAKDSVGTRDFKQWRHDRSQGRPKTRHTY